MLAKILFNIVQGIWFPYLLTHLYNKAWLSNVGLYYFYQQTFFLNPDKINHAATAKIKRYFFHQYRYI